MSERVEYIMRNYDTMRRDLAVLESELDNFKGITPQEVLDTMQFSHPSGDRVQTSNVSDKTCTIAINYRDRLEQINRDWLKHLADEYTSLKEELDFFDTAVSQLSGYLPGLIHDLVVERETWDMVMGKYHICRKTVANARKKAIAELEVLYRKHDQRMAAYLLG